MSTPQMLDHWHANRRLLNARRLSRWLRWRIDKKRAKWFRLEIERQVPLFWGQPMTILHPEHVSGKIARKGYFEVGLTSMLMQRVRPGTVFYDIGAHYGYFSLLGAAMAGEAGHVYSFEPTPRTYERLSKNLEANANCTAVNKAVYNASTQLVFCEMGTRDSSLNHVSVGGAMDADAIETKIDAVSLDDFVLDNRPPDLVKIDAEGAEQAILEGMVGLLETHRPEITLEVGDHIAKETGNRPCRENVDFLLGKGYEVFDFRDGEIRPHTPKSYYDYDNLLFIHPDGPAATSERSEG